MSPGGNNLAGSRFWTPPPPPPPWKKANAVAGPMSERKSYNAIHKVPASDSPYGKAKHVQLVEKDPNRAISLFWAAINAGDRVDSAVKDMACVMKQLDRADEAIEAVKSFRHLCPPDSQVSLDNLLIELYKRSGRIEEEIEILQHRLKDIEAGIAFGPKRTKTARSQGRKVQVTIEQEKARVLGNLAWAYLQQHNYGIAEKLYRQSLTLEPDKNRQCNLAMCLMRMNKLQEAKTLVDEVKFLSGSKPMDETYARAYERAVQMLCEVESKPRNEFIKPCEPFSQNSEAGKPFKLAADRIHTPASSKTSSGVLHTQPKGCWEAFSSEDRRRRYGGNAGGTPIRKLTFEQNVNGQSTLYNQILDSEDEKFVLTDKRSELGVHKCPPLPREDWKRPKRSAPKDNSLLQSPSSCLADEAHEELTEALLSQPTKSWVDFDHGDWRRDKSADRSPVPRSSFEEQTAASVSVHPPTQNLDEPAASSEWPAVSKKSWADMAEEDEDELSPFNEWNNEKGYNDENLNCNTVCNQDDPSNQDEIEDMSLQFGSFGIKGKRFVARSSTVCRSERNRLQVFRDITTRPGSP